MSPSDFWQLSFREFFAAVYAKFPPEQQKSIHADSDEPFFDKEEQDQFAKIIELRKAANAV